MVVLTLFSTDTLKAVDFSVPKQYTLADGSTVPSPTFSYSIPKKLAASHWKTLSAVLPMLEAHPSLGKVPATLPIVVRNNRHIVSRCAGDVAARYGVRLNQTTS